MINARGVNGSKNQDLPHPFLLSVFRVLNVLPHQFNHGIAHGGFLFCACRLERSLGGLGDTFKEQGSPVMGFVPVQRGL
jgi:hypothetical protein